MCDDIKERSKETLTRYETKSYSPGLACKQYQKHRYKPQKVFAYQWKQIKAVSASFLLWEQSFLTLLVRKALHFLTGDLSV